MYIKSSQTDEQERKNKNFKIQNEEIKIKNWKRKP